MSRGSENASGGYYNAIQGAECLVVIFQQFHDRTCPEDGREGLVLSVETQPDKSVPLLYDTISKGIGTPQSKIKGSTEGQRAYLEVDRGRRVLWLYSYYRGFHLGRRSEVVS